MKFSVSQAKQQELQQRMVLCNIRESDLQESFVSSSGPGGQKVNRSATCVHLKHLPSGLEVKMQKARTQGLNRFYARRRLCELIENKNLGRESPQASRQQKIRRQKDRRRRRSRD